MSATSLTSTGVLREYLVANQSGFIAKVRYLFPLGGVALPLSLAALAAAGYFYTTHTLFWRLLATCMFVASLVVMRSILYHMLLLRRRYLSMGHAREHAAAAKLAGEGAADLQPVAGIVTENKSETNGEKLVQYGNPIVGVWRCPKCSYECFPGHLREREARSPFLCFNFKNEPRYDEPA